MILEIRIATFIIITILLSIIFLKKYGVGQKYSCLQLGISLISVYFAKPAGIWWGFIGLIILGIAFENEDCLNKLSENILVIFILQTCSNLIFIIDNMQSILKRYFSNNSSGNFNKYYYSGTANINICILYLTCVPNFH